MKRIIKTGENIGIAKQVQGAVVEEYRAHSPSIMQSI